MARVDLKKIVREELAHLQAVKVESVFPEDYVRLNMNENFFVEPDVMEKIISEACREFDCRKYPENLAGEAVRAISHFLKVDESRVFVGNGLDQVMDILFRTYVGNGDKVIVVEPTFGLYSYFTKICGGNVETVLLNPDFSLNVKKIIETAKDGVSLVIFCSPNNPTGNQFPKEDLEKVLEVEALVVLDEAYVHFADYSLVDEVENYDNLIVMRTFSKSFGLAGIRCGYLVSTSEVVDYMKRITHPFHMSQLTQIIVSKALRASSYFEERARMVIEERERLQRVLGGIGGIKVYPSKANFILLKIVKEGLTSRIVGERLKERKVLVRDVSDKPLLSNCIRVTVGVPEQNKYFVSALIESLEI
ncbi:MAG: histidinol-phosphate transaminase [Candidatus Bathyarchaeia archaeon]